MWHDNRRLFRGGLGVMTSAPQMGKTRFWRISEIQWSKQRKSDLVTRHPLARPIGGNRLLQCCLFSVTCLFLAPPGAADDEGKPARYRRKLLRSRWENEEGFKVKRGAEFGSIREGGANGQNVESNEGTRVLSTCGLHSSVALYFASAFFFFHQAECLERWKR